MEEVQREEKGKLVIDSELFWPAKVSAGSVVYPPGGTFGPRLQRNLQLVVVHSGHVTITVDGVPHTAPANTVGVLFPGHEEFFSFAEDGETNHSWLHILAPQLPNALCARLARLPWPLPLSLSMDFLMHETLALKNSSLTTAGVLQKTLAIQMIWLYIGEGEALLGGATATPDPAIENARRFIHTHLHEPLTLNMIAEAVAVSPAHLIRLFRAELHTTPMAYLWERRVALGAEMLRQTGLNVGEIAARCGFRTSYHFSRRVRQSTGLTPLEIRQQAWES